MTPMRHAGLTASPFHLCRGEEGRGRSSPSCTRVPEEDEQGSWLEGWEKPAQNSLQALELKSSRLPGPSIFLSSPNRASIETNSCLGQDLRQRPHREGGMGSLGRQEVAKLIGKKGTCFKVSTARGTSPECMCFHDGSPTGLNANSDRIRVVECSFLSAYLP